ncbi:hypothetical protein SADUNF_Sadunf14G0094200 [Salix dunnii]|uniref:Uncharacterized protein n=1 Tax=Salix dunnii TaxID=1413687 RepID=A0A835JIX0_9ROSI|nr:hypothetical protein SADUNF_Sadunf14G0094200 [Salix dunnii]
MKKLDCPIKQRKNKAQIAIDIGGLVVLGGVFVVAGLIAAAAFAVKKSRRRDTDMENLRCKNEVKGSPGLCFTLENPSSTRHQNPCLTDGSTGMAAAAIQTDSTELVSTESLILEEDSASMINVENDNFTGDDQEIVLTDDTRQEIIITSFDDCCGMEELSLPVLDSESMNEVEDSIKNDSEDNSSCLVRIEIIRQEEEVDTGRIMEVETKSVNLFEEDEKGYSSEENVTEEEAVGAEKMTAETTVAILWVEDEEEEEEEEDSSEEYVMDEGDESSEETGSASAETNAEAFWPAGSIEVYCYWNTRTP